MVLFNPAMAQAIGAVAVPAAAMATAPPIVKVPFLMYQMLPGWANSNIASDSFSFSNTVLANAKEVMCEI
jgi:hypothetical protein